MVRAFAIFALGSHVSAGKGKAILEWLPVQERDNVDDKQHRKHMVVDFAPQFSDFRFGHRVCLGRGRGSPECVTI